MPYSQLANALTMGGGGGNGAISVDPGPGVTAPGAAPSIGLGEYGPGLAQGLADAAVTGLTYSPGAGALAGMGAGMAAGRGAGAATGTGLGSLVGWGLSPALGPLGPAVGAYLGGKVGSNFDFAPDYLGMMGTSGGSPSPSFGPGGYDLGESPDYSYGTPESEFTQAMNLSPSYSGPSGFGGPGGVSTDMSTGIGTSEGTGAGGNGSTVICTELARQARIDRAAWSTARLYGAMLAMHDPEAFAGYQVWGGALARAMSKSQLLSSVVERLSRPWVAEMAYRVGRGKKGSIVGAAILGACLPFSRLVCRIGKGRVEWAK